MIVEIGDLMRFSVALLKHIDAMPTHESVLVRLREVRIQPDGAKLLVLERVEPMAYEWVDPELV